jgi:hypothetical protein
MDLRLPTFKLHPKDKSGSVSTVMTNFGILSKMERQTNKILGDMSEL